MGSSTNFDEITPLNQIVPIIYYVEKMFIESNPNHPNSVPLCLKLECHERRGEFSFYSFKYFSGYIFSSSKKDN